MITTGNMSFEESMPVVVLFQQTGGGSGVWAAAGLPPGLALNSGGQLTGAATATGSYTAAVTFTPGSGSPVTKNVVFTITTPNHGGTAGTIFAGNMSFQSGAPVNATVEANDSRISSGNGTWSISNLPPGLTAESDEGGTTLVGTPTTLGVYAVTFQYQTTAGSPVYTDTLTVNITITPPAGISTTSLTFQRNTVVASEIDQSDGNITNAAWTVTGLPPGLATGASGTESIAITGTPTVAGTYPVDVTVSQVGGAYEHTATVEITITPAIPVVSIPAPLWNGTSYSQPGTMGTAITGIQCTGSDAPTSWLATGLPAGVTIDDTGLISGTPTASGTFALSITATNAVGTSAAAALTLVIAAANSSGGGAGSAPPALYLPWLHADPTLIDLQMNLRTGVVQSFYAESGGLYLKAGDDVQLAVVIQDLLLGTMLTDLNDLLLVICPQNDFETVYAQANGVEATEEAGGTYFALELSLDAESCPDLQRAFDNLNRVQGRTPRLRQSLPC